MTASHHPIKRIQAASFVMLAFALIFWSQFFMADQALAAPALSAEQTVSEFYKWYLHALASGREPLSDDRKKIARYVSRALTQEIDQQMRSADGMDEDYFIQAQDYLDDWEKNVFVSKAIDSSSGTSVVLALGSSSESRHKLSISLIREDGAWKIRYVQLLS